MSEPENDSISINDLFAAFGGSGAASNAGGGSAGNGAGARGSEAGEAAADAATADPLGALDSLFAKPEPEPVQQSDIDLMSALGIVPGAGVRASVSNSAARAQRNIQREEQIREQQIRSQQWRRELEEQQRLRAQMAHDDEQAEAEPTVAGDGAGAAAGASDGAAQQSRAHFPSAQQEITPPSFLDKREGLDAVNPASAATMPIAEDAAVSAEGSGASVAAGAADVSADAAGAGVPASANAAGGVVEARGSAADVLPAPISDITPIESQPTRPVPVDAASAATQVSQSAVESKDVVASQTQAQATQAKAQTSQPQAQAAAQPQVQAAQAQAQPQSSQETQRIDAIAREDLQPAQAAAKSQATQAASAATQAAQPQQAQQPQAQPKAQSPQSQPTQTLPASAPVSVAASQQQAAPTPAPLNRAPETSPAASAAAAQSSAAPISMPDQKKKNESGANIGNIIGIALIVIAVICAVLTFLLLTGTLDSSTFKNLTSQSGQANSDTATVFDESGTSTSADAATSHAVYSYVVRGTDGGTYEAIETASFDEDGILQQSSIVIDVADEEQAKGLLEQLKEDFGDSVADSGISDGEVYLTIEIDRDDLDVDSYTELLSANMAEFEVVETGVDDPA